MKPVFLMAFLMSCFQAYAADPVPSERLPVGGTWEGLVGVSGGIPHRANGTCATLNEGATASQINTEINNCANNGGGVVFLNQGNYTLTSGRQFPKFSSNLIQGLTNALMIPTKKSN